MQTQYDEDLFFSPKDFLQRLQKDLSECKQNVDIEMYIWGDDKLTLEFEVGLIALVQRGVKVRLLVDAIGSYGWIYSRMKEVISAGIEVRVFHPIPGISRLLQMGPGWVKFFSFMNRRTHRKAIIIDRKIAYIGSFNFMLEALEWRESIVRITSFSVKSIQVLFQDAWNYRPQIHNILCGAHYCAPKINDEYILDMQRSVEILMNAKKRIWLTTSYFNPPRILLKEMMLAARRGVDVRLLLPKLSDISFLRWVAQQFYSRLYKATVKVYEYKPRNLHAKTAILDDCAIVGSGNLNHRSFLKDLELNVILRRQPSLLQLEAQFEQDLLESTLVDDKFVVSFWKRIVNFLVSPIKSSI